MYTSYIKGTGSYLPERNLTNSDLEKMVETSDQWIVERTGIKSRHIAAKGEFTSDLAYHAARHALEAAGLTAADIGATIFATVTGDQPMPSAACVLQAKLGGHTRMAFDVAAACSGYLYGLTIADQFIKSGFSDNILLIGAESLSCIVNYKDRQTCILFGDGAGAAIISRTPKDSKSEVLGFHMAADGTLGDLLSVPAGGSRMPVSRTTLADGLHYVHMKGREVFRSAVRAMSNSCTLALKNAGLESDQVDWLIPHQANLRIIEAMGSHMGIPSDRVIVNIESTGNTSSASIPVAMDQAIRDGRIKRGDVVMQCAFGGGLTYGALVFRY